MASNARIQLTSTSSELGFTGNYPNEKRRNHYGPSMDRSGSFREGVDNRMFGSGISISRGSSSYSGDLPPLSQCLFLDPIVMGDPKYTRSGEFRRVMGFSGGCSSEDNSFGAAHLKPSPPLAMEDLKRFRSSVLDTCNKARVRAKKFDEQLHKLTKYCDTVKQQRSEILTNERSSGMNLKMGALIHRNPPDLVTQKLEDRPKNVLLNKRVRTSVAETRSESLNNGSQRHALATPKGRDLLKDSAVDSDQVEEKIRRLPAGGEGWDKKRKRSVGPVLSRSVDGEAELKRPMYHKLSSEPGPTPSDTNTFRSSSSNGSSGINRMDGTCLATGANIRGIPRMEHDRATTPKDMVDGVNKERHPTKASNKLKNLEENHISGIAPTVVKGKASRASRTASIGTTNSSPNIPHVSGTPEEVEHTPSVLNKIPQSSGAQQRKRAMSSGSSSPPRTQWGGRRPQKISRTRRANLVSPVSSHHDEIQIQSEGCSPSDFGARLPSSSSGGPIGSLPSRSAAANGSQQFKIKLENVQSPARLSESDESGAVENRLKEKVSVELEEKGVNGVVQNGGMSPTMLLTTTKKNKFVMKDEIGDGVQRQGRSGRGSPFPRVGMSPARDKVDKPATTKPFRSARPGPEKNGSKSGRPLKKMSDRKGFSRLGHMQNSGSHEINGAFDDREELLAAANFAHNASYLACSGPFWKRMESTFASVSLEDKSYLSQQLKCSDELQGNLPQTFGQENNILEELVDHCEEGGNLFGTLDFEKRFNKATPLYQRVLSALIVEDEIEEYEEMTIGRNMSISNDTCRFPYDTFIDDEPRKRNDMIELEGDSVLGISSFDSSYEQMDVNDKLLLELQSIGLYPDSVPNLDDKEDEIITQQIVELKKGLDQQISRKKSCLDKLYKAIGSSTEKRNLEQVAMDRLVELSYRKLLATRGSSRAGIPKVPKQVALGFARRTLARCRKFEESGTSCFSEPALRDIIFAPPSWVNVAEPITSKNKHLESRTSLPKASPGGLADSYETFTHLTDEAFAKNGPISNRGKKKEVLLDDFATATPFRATSSTNMLSNGTKGKRSERERDGIPKAGPGRPPQQGNFKGERKTKTKPKHKTAQLSTTSSSNANITKFSETRAPVTNIYNNNNNIPQDLSSREITNLPLSDLDPIEELGVGTGIDNEHEDLSSLFNFEDDGLQEHFSAGLEIPMDDLSGLNMF